MQGVLETLCIRIWRPSLFYYTDVLIKYVKINLKDTELDPYEIFNTKSRDSAPF